MGTRGIQKVRRTTNSLENQSMEIKADEMAINAVHDKQAQIFES